MIATRTPLNRRAVLNEFRWAAQHAQAPRIRPISEFAEREIILPSGPADTLHFKCDRQPFTRLWFREIESGRWNRYVFTGPQQIGKTLVACIIPLLYHLFEVGERVIFGLPNMEMAGDKWRDEILPVIERTRYRDLLPAAGGGSRGGTVEAIRFTHGRTLKFMSGGGSDKRRSSYTSRVLIVTEIDDLDSAGEESDEADKLKQMEGRTRAFDDNKQVYLECTVSTTEGRTWQEYTRSTQSRILLPCPHCGAWVSPERADLFGWQDAVTEFEAKQQGQFFCPACKEGWTEPERTAVNHRARLVHKDQQIDATGSVSGAQPQTETLGFRVSAVNNAFVSAGSLAQQEWKASRDADEDNVERELCQWCWAIPHAPARFAATPLTHTGLMARIVKRPQGEVPHDALQLVATCDIGKWKLHWMFGACRAGATPHLVDYGVIDVHSSSMPVEQAILTALLEFDELTNVGWIQEETGDRVVPDLKIADSRFYPNEVIEFCRQRSEKCLAAQGHGQKRYRAKPYHRPKNLSKDVTLIGLEYHLQWEHERQAYVLAVNADFWKSHLHERLATPLDQPGAMTFYNAAAREHLQLVKHLTAEQKLDDGTWETLRKTNHWLDCGYNFCAGCHYLGAELIPTPKPLIVPSDGIQVTTPTLPDGRKYFVTEREGE